MLNELLQGAVKAIPGYMEGQQQAVRDNWQDLNMSNQVRAGQLNNLFSGATLNNRLQRDFNQTGMSNLAFNGARRQDEVEEVNLSAAINQALANVDGSYYLPWLRNDAAEQQYNLGMQMGGLALDNANMQASMQRLMYQYMRQNPSAFFGLMLGGGFPGLGGGIPNYAPPSTNQ